MTEDHPPLARTNVRIPGGMRSGRREPQPQQISSGANGGGGDGPDSEIIPVDLTGLVELFNEGQGDEVRFPRNY